MILLAVRNGPLADSMRFVLELEGYSPFICDEASLSEAPVSEASCLVLDQSVLLRLSERGEQGILSALGLPVILMVAAKTKVLMDRVATLRITSVLEKPLLGSALIDEIERVKRGGEKANGET